MIGTSFRDPAGYLVDDGNRIVRYIAPEHVSDQRRFLTSICFDELVVAGKVIGLSKWAIEDTGWARAEHPRVPFPSYPFEWSPSMLASAGLLELEIQRKVRSDGWMLKDASSFNVLFDGTRPVHCDHLSFYRDPENGKWPAYGQYIRNFITPLLVNHATGRSIREIFLANRDGLRLADVSVYIPASNLLKPGVFLHVTLPAWLEQRRKKNKLTQRFFKTDRASMAATGWLVDSLIRLTNDLASESSRSGVWTNYMETRDHYSAKALSIKREFIGSCLSVNKADWVLDIGANAGEYSQLAAMTGAKVVALDEDMGAVERIYKSSVKENLRILPLHINFARPSPATGWRLCETLSFSDRASGQFDTVLMLAVIHHFIVSERIPANQLFEEIAKYCKKYLVAEFVPNYDPMFREIAGENIHHYNSWNYQTFLDAASAFFEVERQEKIVGTERILVNFRRKS